MNPFVKSKLMSAAEAAELIQHQDIIGCSGFTPSGYPKAVPEALAQRAERLHAEGRDFKVSIYTGASTGDELDGSLARAKAIQTRLPYQGHADLRKGLNSGEVEYMDIHLSHVAQQVRWGFLPKPTVALVECCDVDADGRIWFTASGGVSATYLEKADRIILELNTFYGDKIKGYHDVFVSADAPFRTPLALNKSWDRMGKEYFQVDPSKIVAIVETNLPDKSGAFKDPDSDSVAIAGHILEFLKWEKKKGRLHDDQPYQSGVGNVANAVLSSMGKDPAQSPVCLFTEVIQDCVFDLLDNDKLIIASGASLTFSPAGQERFRDNLDNWRDKFVIRQQEITNHPEITRRLGTVCMNTALELDIFGHVNSTHVMGTRMMNGLGGSGDFARNGFLTIFMTQSTAKDGAISSIVPMCSHIDHTEHDTMIFVTEQGLADVRGMGPARRAREIIEKCAHPDYRPLLLDYLEHGLKHSKNAHTPHDLARALEFHVRFQQTGTMKP